MCWLVETYFEKGVISEKICKMIYTWNTERGCENWDMNDVMKVLYFPFGRLIMWIFFYATMEEFVELGVIECTNPEVEHSRTEKGEEYFDYCNLLFKLK